MLGGGMPAPGMKQVEAWASARDRKLEREREKEMIEIKGYDNNSI